jgi:hypothetical protein
MSSKSMHADRPNELYDTKVREVVTELSGTVPLIIGLRVDVTFLIDKDSTEVIKSSVNGTSLL